MAFFSAKNAGLAFMIVAVLSIISAIALIVMSIMDMDVESIKAHDLKYFIILAIGEIICACLYFTYGQKVRSGAIDRKIDILANFVKIVGITMIIGAIFSAVAALVDDAEIGLVELIVGILIGLLILFIATKINDGKQTTGDKLIWIILLVAFVIGLLWAILEIISIVGILIGICDLIIYSFMILLLIDEEVKSEMGI